MTKEEKTKVEKHYDRLYSIASGITSDIPDDIRDAMKAAYLAGADYALDIYCPHWISVEDELPTEEGQYLVHDEMMGIVIGKYFDGCTSPEDPHTWKDDSEWSWLVSVTHWQRLPAPPEKGGEQ